MAEAIDIETARPENVYQKINRVMSILAKEGISKDNTAPSQIGGYSFRGIDDVYNTLAPILSDVGLIVFPTVLDRICTERPGRDNKVIFCVALQVQYSFVSTDDGSSAEVILWGEGMDSGDKATNKALSAAYKYACFETFCIPIDGQDSEQDTPEISTIDEGKVADFVASIDELFVMGRTERNREVAECVDEEALRKVIGDLNDVRDDDHATKQAVWKQLNSSVRSYIREMEKVQ